MVWAHPVTGAILMPSGENSANGVFFKFWHYFLVPRPSTLYQGLSKTHRASITPYRAGVPDWILRKNSKFSSRGLRWRYSPQWLESYYFSILNLILYLFRHDWKWTNAFWSIYRLFIILQKHLPHKKVLKKLHTIISSKIPTFVNGYALITSLESSMKKCL